MRRSRGLVATMSVVALAAAASGCGPHKSTSISGSPSTAAPGRILAYDDQASQLVVERANATTRQLLKGSVSTLPGVSADNSYLLTNTGVGLLQVTPTGVKKLRSPITSISRNALPPGLAFLDDNKYVLAPRGDAKNGVVKALAIHGGKSVVLGHGYDASGDPSAVAAYIDLAVGPQVTDFAEGAQIQPESKIVRAVAGKKPTTLITASALDQLIGQSSGVHWLMSATPNPDGSEVLVTASSIDAPSDHSLLIVLTPSGQQVSEISGADLDGGYWSPDGSRLVYFDKQANRMLIWAPGTSAPTSIPLPAQPTPWYDCVWSPDGRWLVCADGSSDVRGEPTGWIIVNPSTHAVSTVKTSDEPVAWLPSAG